MSTHPQISTDTAAHRGVSELQAADDALSALMCMALPVGEHVGHMDPRRPTRLAGAGRQADLEDALQNRRRAS